MTRRSLRLAAGIVLASLSGCGLTLDLDPPDDTSVSVDAALLDGMVPDDAGAPGPDAAPMDARADAPALDVAAMDVAADVRDAARADGPELIDVNAVDVCTPGPEVCNGFDDDCDGVVDDGIAPLACRCGPPIPSCVAGMPAACPPCGCARFVVVGAAAGGDGRTYATPMASIVGAMSSMSDAGETGVVCVGAVRAGPAGCGGTYPESLTIVEGISVVGGYEADPARGWRQADDCTTEVTGSDVSQPTVRLTALVTSATRVERMKMTPLVAMNATASTTVRFFGGGVLRSCHVEIASVLVSRGIEAVGSGASVPTIEGTTVRALDPAGVAGQSTGVFVQSGGLLLQGSYVEAGRAQTRSAAVEIAGGDGAVVEGSTLLGGAAGTSATSGASFGVLASNAARVQVRRNMLIRAGDGAGPAGASVGVQLGQCSDGSIPHDVSANQRLAAGAGEEFAAGIAVVGCDATIANNQRVVGRAVEGSSRFSRGVACLSSPARHATCDVIDNVSIAGVEAPGVSTQARGIQLSGNVQSAIRRNRGVVGCEARGSASCVGVDAAGNEVTATIDANTIVESDVAALAEAVGIRVGALRVTVQNNYVRVREGTGIRVDLEGQAPVGRDPIVHYNTVVAVGAGPPLRPVSLLAVRSATPAFFTGGVFLSNVAVCTSGGTNRAAFDESGAAPRRFERNDLFGCAADYRGRDGIPRSVALLPAGALNFSADPMFTDALASPAVAPMSPVIDRDPLLSGYPDVDWHGDARPRGLLLDVGADEAR